MAFMSQQRDDNLAPNGPVTNRGRIVPAWLMSTVVHLVVLILLILLVRGAPTTPVDEPDRQIAIALVERDANSNAMQYLSDGDAGEQASKLPASKKEESAIPDVPPPSIPAIKLPATREVNIGQANSAQLVAIPKMTNKSRGPILPGLNDDAVLAEEAARRAGQADRGSPGKLAIFGGEAIAGHSFIFVIDRSKSMGAEGLGALSAAAHELNRELRGLEPQHKFQIIAYNQTPSYMGERNLLDATPENIAKVRGYFAALAAYGATAHETALLSALRRKPDVIVFLTDGGDPYLNSAQLERIKSRAGGTTSIHCIQFGFGAIKEQDNFMQRLAGQNRGGYRYVDMSNWQRK
jgi:hypothetical protein